MKIEVVEKKEKKIVPEVGSVILYNTVYYMIVKLIGLDDKVLYDYVNLETGCLCGENYESFEDLLDNNESDELILDARLLV